MINGVHTIDSEHRVSAAERQYAFTYELYEHAGLVPYDAWYTQGIRALIFDMDGTVAPRQGPCFDEDVLNALVAQGIGKRFHEKIALVSNSRHKDRVEACARTMASRLGTTIWTISRTEEDQRRKPHPQMGLWVAAHCGVTAPELGIIGDRRSTDVTFGYNLPAGAVALCNKRGKGDAFGVPVIRLFEKAMVLRDVRRGRAKWGTAAVQHGTIKG